MIRQVSPAAAGGAGDRDDDRREVGETHGTKDDRQRRPGTLAERLPEEIFYLLLTGELPSECGSQALRPSGVAPVTEPK